MHSCIFISSIPVCVSGLIVRLMGQCDVNLRDCISSGGMEVDQSLVNGQGEAINVRNYSAIACVFVDHSVHIFILLCAVSFD